MNYRNHTHTLQNNIYAWKQEVYRYLTKPEELFPDELDRLLRQSFANEEFLMICSDYPEYEHQCVAHQCFFNCLQRRREEPEQYFHLQTFLHHWMRQHDLLYDRYFQEYYSLWEQQERSFSWEHWNPEYVVLTTKIGRLG